MSPVRVRPRVREPGLPVLPPGIERYRVVGGGAVVVAVFAGDRLTVIDKEGRQRAELAPFTADGRFEPGMLGAKAAGPATGINRLLAGESEDSAEISAALKRRGLPGKIDRAIALFEHESALENWRSSQWSATASLCCTRSAKQ